MHAHYQNLEATLRVLAETHSEAVVPVLLAALDGGDGRIREEVIPLLLQRRSPDAENELLRRWPEMTGHWKQLIIRRDGWLTPAVRRAVLGTDLPLAAIACAAAAELRDYELIPVLVALACEKKNEISDLTLATLLSLTESLAEEVAAPRDYRNRKDPQLQKAHVLASLEKGAQTFDQHLRRELLEALLILAGRDNAVVGRILQEPTERAFAPLMDLLTHSSRPAIIRLMLSYLDASAAPLPALHALGKRRDITFLRQLVRRIGEDPQPVVRTNLKRIENIPWLKSQSFLLNALQEAEQPGAVRYIMLSGAPRQDVLDALAQLLRDGKLLGRQAASLALADFCGAEANAVVQMALDDREPTVRANIAAQLRTRGMAGSMNLLVAMLDSPHDVERQAARKAMEEFTFASYVASYDYMDEETRDKTGMMVRRIDERATALLREELQASSRSRRRRGLEMAQHMFLVLELQDAVAALVKDEDQYLRLEAVRVLGSCPTDISEQVLREALNDSQPLVQEAAQRGLAVLCPPREEETLSLTDQQARQEANNSLEAITA